MPYKFTIELKFSWFDSHKSVGQSCKVVYIFVIILCLISESIQ